jgi:SAM-dependent methyltransferase
MPNLKNYLRKQRQGALRYMERVEQEGIGEKRIQRYETAFEAIKTRPVYWPVLDIGCREGLFLDHLKRKGVTKLSGIELIKEAAVKAQMKGHNVINGDAHQLPFEDGQFATVTLLHSLEHCYSPVIILKEVDRVLIKDGLVYIEVPGRVRRPKVSDREQLLKGERVEYAFGEDEILSLISDRFNVINYRTITNPNAHQILARKPNESTDGTGTS